MNSIQKLAYPVSLIALVFSIACALRTERLPYYSKVPEFKLTEENGSPFDSQVLGGKVWVADFIYTTCPGPCPRMTSQMRKLQDAVSKMPEVRLVSFTIDPRNDTPPVLAEYAKVHGASTASWYFLTGPEPPLENLDRNVFKLGDIAGPLDHSTRFVLVDQTSRVRGYYAPFEPQAIDRIMHDIRNLANAHS